jgi:hypothetical protein
MTSSRVTSRVPVRRDHAEVRLDHWQQDALEDRLLARVEVGDPRAELVGRLAAAAP